jgi:glucose/arabinose dehydrogenase
MPVCTPPPCGEDESYHCPDECPGGCGTVCATHTPTPHSENDELSEAEDTSPASVQTFPDPSKFAWAAIAFGLNNPLGVTHAGDGSGRLFILEQPGSILVVENRALLPIPFLDIKDRVNDGNNEQGLLGLAFHPNFKDNGIFFVNYTGEGGDTFISRFNVTDDANIADPASETVLLRLEQPFANHNGGHLLFGPDGYLYIGTGDGGSGGDPEGNAQNLDSLLGKMLRIDVDHGDLYAIPSDNPFAYGGGRPEIWASGLRNPWRYTFDRATGDLYIADVGQNKWEEINLLAVDKNGILPGGSNFGWDFWEGSHPYEGTPTGGVTMITPIWEYDHSGGCSVTGGIVYRGAIPEWQGIYIYGDFCLGTIWGLLRDADGVWQNTILFQTSTNITSFGEDEAGELLVVDRNGGVFQLENIP